MQIDKIYFDMDGVLVNFDQGVEEYCKMDVPVQGIGASKHDYMWSKIREIDHFYAKLKPLEGAIELFNLLNKKYPGKCEILTGIPRPDKGIKHAGEDKKEWIKRYISEDIPVHIVYRIEKKNYAKKGAILIDDLESTIKDWNACGGFGIYHQSIEETLRILKENKII